MKMLYIHKEVRIFYDRSFIKQPWVVQIKFFLFFWKTYACCLSYERAVSLALSVAEKKFYDKGK